MATTVTGTVDALKRLFERNGNTAGSFINKHGSVFNETSQSSNASNNLVRNIPLAQAKPSLNRLLRPPSPSSDISSSTFSSFDDQVSSSKNSFELARTKPAPPKVKPKPVIYRRIVSSSKNEAAKQPELNVVSSNSETRFAGNKPAKGEFGCSTDNGGDPKEQGLLKQEDGINNALPPVPNTIRPPGSKKPPPVAKKPRSILSGYSNRSSHSHSKYDEALEKQFGMKVDASSYDYVEHWANHQAKAQLEMAQHKAKRSETENESKLPTNGEPIQKSRAPSVSSSTGMSGSNFTNSSIRSILKKGRPSLGAEKKRLTFKADNELITKYNYPSEDIYNDTDSLDHLRSALDSDSDSSSSTFEDTFDCEPDIVGSRGNQRNRNKIIIASSNSSYTSSSTLKGSTDQQLKQPSRSNGSRNHSKSNGFMEPRTLSPSKRSSAVILTPTKNDTFKRFSNSGIRFHY